MASPPPPPAAAAAPAAAASGPPPPAQVVGNAFVHQYYNILHQSPELVYRFYQESSRLGRPSGTGDDGMETVTSMDVSSSPTPPLLLSRGPDLGAPGPNSHLNGGDFGVACASDCVYVRVRLVLQAINDKIVSMGIDRAEIKAVDAQESLCGGVTVLVMGHLTGRNSVSREFVQSFFLAPQEKGYFVLNDILRYVGEEGGDEGGEQQPATEVAADVVAADVEAATPASILANGTVGGDTVTVPQDASPQPECQVAEPALNPKEEVLNREVVCNPPNDVNPIVEETPVPEVINEVPNNVKVMKEYRPPAPAVPSRPAPPKTEKQSSPAPALVADAPAFTPNPQSGSFQDPEVDAHAIYVRSLPLNATPQQLEEEFKRFGAIKHDGIQVRSNKIQGFCYGFVEFEDASAVQTAIEASPVTIGERQCYVEEKRTTGGGSRGGRFPPVRGGNFRGEGIRGRGTYNGGRGYGRGEFNYRSDYGGRGGGRGGSSRGDVGYQRVDHSSAASGRGARAPSAATAVAK
ncbi:putative G3BP-like protein [Zea mays]|uniref:Putative G3BP-like protein n=1 Tax=Zea mays TaxID=4577 RepID=A0A3L6G5W9_MAIZE|nr:putative G3BP-like protein [Zea mays]